MQAKTTGSIFIHLKRRHFICVILSMLLLTGCQNILQTPQAGTDQTATTERPTGAEKVVKTKQNHSAARQTPEQTTTEPESKASHEQKLEHLPKMALSADVLYEYLLAEFAFNEKQYQRAYKHFLQLARKTQDSRIAKSALRAALAFNQSEAILTAVNLWAKLEPRTVDVLQIQAIVFLKVKKDELAAKLLSQIYHQSKSEELAATRIQTILTAVPQYPRLKKILDQVVAQHPGKVSLYLILANTALKYKDFETSLKALDHILEIEPENEEAYMLKASAMQKQGFHDEAIKIYQQAIDQLEEKSLLRLDYTKLLLTLGDRKQANQQLQLIIDENPDDPNLLASIAQLAVEIKEFELAASLFKQLYFYPQHQQHAALMLGMLAYEQKDNDEALKWLNQVKDEALLYEAVIRKAVILADKKQYRQAIEVIDSIQSDKQKQKINLLRIKAEMLALDNQLQAAYDTYSQALKYAPRNIELRYGRAMIAEQLQRIELSEKDLKYLLELEPENSMALNALGYILTEKTTRYQEARQLIEKALALEPDDSAINDSMGWVLYKLGQLEQALVYLKKAYELDSKNGEIAAHYGEVLWIVGRQQEARKIWESALMDNADHQILKTTISNFLKP